MGAADTAAVVDDARIPFCLHVLFTSAGATTTTVSRSPIPAAGPVEFADFGNVVECDPGWRGTGSVLLPISSQ
jgi:hypothetical protein